MEILITGGAGFIGVNLAHRLLSQGHSITAYDNLSRGKREYLPDGVRLVQGDIRDKEKLSKAMRGADAVVHLAAYGSVVESVVDPHPNFEINVAGTLQVLECARHAAISRLVFASTGGALIGDATPPVDESSLPKPISPYGASKLCGEAYCHAYAKAYDLSTIALRFANVYGPYSAHKKGAVTKFFKCLLREEPMPIFGDGTASRDFLHVNDLCAGICLALVGDAAPGEVFHLASGVETTTIDLARHAAAAAGRENFPCTHLPKRRGEVHRNFARYDLAKQRLGFEPTITMTEGLRATWDWYREHEAEVLAIEESDS